LTTPTLLPKAPSRRKGKNFQREPDRRLLYWGKGAICDSARSRSSSLWEGGREGTQSKRKKKGRSDSGGGDLGQRKKNGGSNNRKNVS